MLCKPKLFVNLPYHRIVYLHIHIAYHSQFYLVELFDRFLSLFIRLYSKVSICCINLFLSCQASLHLFHIENILKFVIVLPVVAGTHVVIHDLKILFIII